MALPSASMRFSKRTRRAKIIGNENQQITVYYAQWEFSLAVLLHISIATCTVTANANKNK